MADADVLARLRAAIDGAGPPVGGPGAEPSPPKPHGDPMEGTGIEQAVGKAVSFLIRSTQQKPITVAEARTKLLGRDLDEEVVDAAVTRAVAMRLLDDAAFATAWVSDRGVKRGYGRVRLQRELRRRKVPEQLIDTALCLMDATDEVAAATTFATAKAQAIPATVPPPRVAQRLVGMLVRRGYRSDIAHQVARRVTAVDRDWD